jgi:UDPglucose--hexose-1-phosphate uridylyltransferase
VHEATVASAAVWKSSGRLADGREIIYFDEAPGSGRAQVRDPRDLGEEQAPGAGPESGLRWDPLVGEWVVIAAQRQGRTFLPPLEQCPLCPSRPGRPTEIPASDYDVVVFENRFPSLSGAHAAQHAAGAGPVTEAPAGPAGATAARAGAGDVPPAGDVLAGDIPAGQDLLTARRPAVGRCEVVCFTADHDSAFAYLTPHRARTVVEAWADRTAVLGAMGEIRQVFCFENKGEEIGVTLHHPHGQIYGFPFVTPRTTQLLGQARAYARGGHGNLFDDVVASELSDGTRVVASNEHWTAFVPAAARWPYEVLLFPAMRVPDLPALGDAARDAFCELYLDVLLRLDALFGSLPPYIAAWYQAPAGDAASKSEFGLHLRVMSVRRAPGKLKYLAGTESGMGVWINDVVPETAALRLREAR